MVQIHGDSIIDRGNDILSRLLSRTEIAKVEERWRIIQFVRRCFDFMDPSPEIWRNYLRIKYEYVVRRRERIRSGLYFSISQRFIDLLQYTETAKQQVQKLYGDTKTRGNQNEIARAADFLKHESLLTPEVLNDLANHADNSMSIARVLLYQGQINSIRFAQAHGAGAFLEYRPLTISGAYGHFPLWISGISRLDTDRNDQTWSGIGDYIVEQAPHQVAPIGRWEYRFFHYTPRFIDSIDNELVFDQFVLLLFFLEYEHTTLSKLIDARVADLNYPEEYVEDRSIGETLTLLARARATLFNEPTYPTKIEQVLTVVAKKIDLECLTFMRRWLSREFSFFVHDSSSS
ncbi:MAG: hypothetical protein O3A46_14125 [Candidatus Poribacteria bacterium]|nr:hypothetical protein [Candidatus Poribacteria bacterium]